MLGGKRIRRVVDHVLGFVPDSQNAVSALLDGDDGGLVDDDAFPGYGNERIRSA